MDYTPKEQEILSVMERTDFKNLSKNDFISFASKLGELRPEVAAQALAQFPELANMIRSTMSEYKGMLDTVVESDDKSLAQIYGILNTELSGAGDSRREYIEFADKVRSDLSKCLDNPNLTSEQQKEIRDQEMEVLRMVDKKDTEIRVEERKVSDTADKKDSEKRQFNWKLIEAASYVALIGVGIGAAALGGKFDIKLPKLKK